MDKKLKIEFRHWYWQCGDGCCDDCGTTIIFNGSESGRYAGYDPEEALIFILSELGYNPEIKHTNER